MLFFGKEYSTPIIWNNLISFYFSGHPNTEASLNFPNNTNGLIQTLVGRIQLHFVCHISVKESFCTIFFQSRKLLQYLHFTKWPQMWYTFKVVDYLKLITCVIAWSNPRKLFSFYASGKAGHHQSTMTSHNDLRTWCHERQVCFLIKQQTSKPTAPRTHAFITSGDNRHTWTDGNSLKAIGRQWVRKSFSVEMNFSVHLTVNNMFRKFVLCREERVWIRLNKACALEKGFWIFSFTIFHKVSVKRSGPYAQKS